MSMFISFYSESYGMAGFEVYAGGSGPYAYYNSGGVYDDPLGVSSAVRWAGEWPTRNEMASMWDDVKVDKFKQAIDPASDKKKKEKEDETDSLLDRSKEYWKYMVDEGAEPRELASKVEKTTKKFLDKDNEVLSLLSQIKEWMGEDKRKRQLPAGLTDMMEQLAALFVPDGDPKKLRNDNQIQQMARKLQEKLKGDESKLKELIDWMYHKALEKVGTSAASITDHDKTEFEAKVKAKEYSATSKNGKKSEVEAIKEWVAKAATYREALERLEAAVDCDAGDKEETRIQKFMQGYLIRYRHVDQDDVQSWIKKYGVEKKKNKQQLISIESFIDKMEGLGKPQDLSKETP